VSSKPAAGHKAADFILARKARPETLSDAAIFIERFMGYALGAIEAPVVPGQVLEALNFETVHRLSKALRDSGFQETYDSITGHYIELERAGPDAIGLESLKEEQIAAAAEQLGKRFAEQVIEELPGYQTAFQKEMADEIYSTSTAIASNIINAMPGVHDVLNFRELGENVYDLQKQVRRYKAIDQATAKFLAAQKKAQEMNHMIEQFDVRTAKKASLLSAVGLITDVYRMAIKRA
jgi:hypothetical protein